MHLCLSKVAITAKVLRNPVGHCTSILTDSALHNVTQALSAVFDLQQLDDRDTTDPHNVYLADAMPRERSRFVRAQREQTAA